MNASDQLRHLRRLGQLVRLGSWRVEAAGQQVTWDDEVRDIHEVGPDYQPNVEDGLKFYPPEWRERVREVFFACVREGTPIDEVVEIVTAKGNRLWVRTIGEAVRDETGAIVAVQGGFQDISSIKQVESERNALAARLNASLQSMSDAFIMLDRGWRFTYVNPQAERLLRRPSDHLLGRNMWEEFPEGVGTIAQTEYEKVMAHGGSTTFEIDFSPLEVWFEVNAFAAEDGLSVYFRDTTERHKTQALLQEALERFRIVTQATADVVWDWNLVADEIWWSEGMRTLFGYEFGRLSAGSSSWTDAIHPDDRERVVASIRAAIDTATEDQIWSDEYRFLRADGSCAQVTDRGFVIRNEAGKAIRMVGSMVDATQQRELEAQLRQSQRLDAVGQLTGGVAHDFNNLLTVVLGNAELLEQHLADRPRLRAIAEMTRMAAERGAELTARLLAFSRRQALDPKPTDIDAQIQNMGALLQRVLGDQFELRIRAADALWPALIDAPQLESAVLNLCINARDAMPDGGAIDISMANVSVDGFGHHDGAPAGAYVLVTVADTGAGMDSETLARAFEPFFTTKDVGKGSGLGLSMVYGFVTQSKGHVKIHSTLGKGTQVKLYLPRAAQSAATAHDTPATPAPQQGTERILVVEDDDLVRAQVTAEFEMLGYAVISVSTGPQAIEALRRTPDFDLLFTDVVLPGGMNGRQVADEARKLMPDLPVLFTSGYAEDVIVHHGRVDPGFQLLRKPYRRRDLAAKVRRALTRAE